MNVACKFDIDETALALRDCHERQRQAYLNDPVPDLAQRRRDLMALRAMINDNRDQIIEAISADYGNRSVHESLFAEIIAVTDEINDALKNLRRWTRVQKRRVDLSMFAGGRNRVIPQPLGCVGIIVPWNFPCNLSFIPLTAAFAAGNRAMVKMSENSRAFTRLLIQLSPQYFDADKLSFFEETGGVGIEFSQIPFDLLFFTGSTQTGKAVMASAARNLTPVVLELGGKCPAIIDPNYPLKTAVERIMFVKQFNAGQICTNVDYVFVQRSQIDDFVREAQAWTAVHVPDIHSVDYTSVIDDRSFQRLEQTLEDVRARGGRVISLNPDQPADPGSRKFPLSLALDTTPEMIIRNRETFGPVLMVLPYETPDEVIAHINAHDRPLAIYPFTHDAALLDRYLTRTMSGGVTVNDGIYHVVQHDMPFGGVGASGMGHYHGFEGFQTFSKMRPVFYQARFSAMKWLQPPYGTFATRVYRLLTWLKR